jgi:hypothetical protein
MMPQGQSAIGLPYFRGSGVSPNLQDMVRIDGDIIIIIADTTVVIVKRNFLLGPPPPSKQ